LIDAPPTACVILGIGNLLMGDEGVGVHAVRAIEAMVLPPGVTCVDGGTGGLHLLGLLDDAARVVLIDATIDGQPAGTVRRLQPRFSRDYPATLTAHDIGLKDLLDTLHLMDRVPEVILFAVSIDGINGLETELSPGVRAILPDLVRSVLQEAAK
jgi:hydrogenase maturation protease